MQYIHTHTSTHIDMHTLTFIHTYTHSYMMNEMCSLSESFITNRVMRPVNYVHIYNVVD